MCYYIHVASGFDTPTQRCLLYALHWEMTLLALATRFMTKLNMTSSKGPSGWYKRSRLEFSYKSIEFWFLLSN